MTYENICARWKSLAQVAAGIVPTRLPLEPYPSEISAVNDDFQVMIDTLDPLILAYGEMLVANGMDPRNLHHFKDQLRTALEGNATYCVDEMSETLHEDLVRGVA